MVPGVAAEMLVGGEDCKLGPEGSVGSEVAAGEGRMKAAQDSAAGREA